MADTINVTPPSLSSDHDLLIRIDQRVLQLFNSFDTFRIDTVTQLKDHENRIQKTEDFPVKWNVEKRLTEHDAMYEDYRTRQTGWKLTTGGWKGLISVLGFIALIVGLVLNLKLFK